MDAFAGEDESVPDWDPADDLASDVDAFEGAPEFAASLEMPVSGSTAADVCAAVEHAVARAEVLPQYLQAGRHAWRDFSTGQVGVQAIKSREADHVRYRRVAEYPNDVELQAVVQGMRAAAREELCRCDCGRNLFQLPWPPCSACRGVQEFLAAAHQGSLRATQLQERQPGSEQLKAEFSKLLEDLPQKCRASSAKRSCYLRAVVCVRLWVWLASIRASSSSWISCARAGRCEL